MAKILKESPLRKKRQRVWRIRFVLLVFLFVGLLVGLSYLCNINKFAIQSVQVVGAKSVDEQTVEKIANETLDQKYLFLFSKRNIFIYAKNRIEKNILERMQRISDLKIKLEKKVLVININEREGQYLWCEGKETFHNCYFLDDTSYIFSIAPYFSDNVYFKIYGALPSPEVDPIGQNVFKDDYLAKVLDFKKQLELLGFKIIALNYSGDETKFLLEQRGNTTNPEIIFNKNDNFTDVMSNLSILLQNDKVAKEFKDKYQKLLYIDLRYGNKIYYKF